MAKPAQKLARLEPVPTAPVEFAGVTLSLAPPLPRYSLRARDPRQLEKLLGLAPPAKIGEVKDGIACLGPDEWLWRGAGDPPSDWGEDSPVSIVDISERSVCLMLEGPEAWRVLASGCPLDLERFAAGRATRTIYETVEIVIFRESETRFAVEVWRSFADWLWLSLKTAAAEL